MENYVGKRLDGRYEIQELIGVGGMAVVYKAYDNIDDRIVAVKILKEEYLANEDFRRRFKNESKAIAVLSHPNIVKVYDVSFGDRLQYIVMEYVDGITLKEYIEQQKVIDWKEAVHFTTQILRALQHAHDKGIVHRDIKPQNIMLLPNGNIKVADFGIARFSRNETKTMTESAIGSVHYISPEQARGEVTDNKADIYSVGVVLYEMITGQLPFQSESAVSVAIMQLQADPKKPRELNPMIPVGLEQITMHAMEKNVADRYQSAAEMLMDLDELKRNPAVTFDYTCFVDKEPTKFVPTGAAGLAVPRSSEDDAPEEDYASDAQLAKRKKTIAIVTGVSVAVVAVIAVVLIVVAAMGGFSGDKVAVPNFLGMNYEEEIRDNEEFAQWQFVTNAEYSTTREEGTVIAQDPPDGRKIDPKTDKITLTIASASQPISVPDVTGYDEASAKQALRKAGFTNIDVSYEFDKDTEVNRVIRTDPAANSDASPDGRITIYLNNGQDDSQVPLPNLVGMTLEEAQAKAESQELTVRVDRRVDSDQPADTIISQNPVYVNEQSTIAKGSEITVIVSNGQGTSKKVSVQYKLPDENSRSAKVEFFLNGSLLKSDTMLLNGSSRSIEVEGSGTQDLVIQIDGSQYCTATVNFDSGNATISYDDNYARILPLPNVVGKEVSEAMRILKDAGFNPVVGNTGANGTIVIKQDPSGDSAKEKSTITLTVGDSTSDDGE